jgi:DNA-binding beta-propeller fold protein YncE
MRVYQIIIALVVLVSSCDEPITLPQKEHFLSNGVLIANEGNFQWGNASVSFYDAENDTILQEVFQGVNQRPLGDVLQSITLKDDKAYLVLNNSGKVEVVDKNSFKLETTISGFISPRYIQIVSPNKAYVTDLYADKIAVADLNSNEISAYIHCEGWTEEMVQIDDLVYVANLESNQICVIDSNEDAIVDRISVSTSIKSLKKDRQNRLWVCGEENGVGMVLCMESQTLNVLYTHTFDGENPSDLFVSDDGHDVYFLSNGVWHINEFTDEMITEPIIPAEGKLFYGLSVHDDKIYIADAINYVQKGRVWVYDLQSNLLDQWEAGMIPSEFDFIDL